MFDELIENDKNTIINSLSELIKFNSVSIENSNDTENPFGKECTDVLNYTLTLANSMGFKTKNIDNYCGYIEFGEGKELIGIIGHLDVVPANSEDGWTTPPFVPTIKSGKLFGRGSIDDKGPVISALYAMKAVKDTVKVSKRVRLILGLNEEKSWKCINYYKTQEEFPTIGFSPDANFPAIYAEKGIMSLELANNFKIKNFEILDINCNGNAINVVPKYCSITLKRLSSSNLQFSDDENIKTTIQDNNIKIEAYGVAAHAAHPELGKNAIKILVQYLMKNFDFETDYLETIYNMGLFDITSPRFLSDEEIKDESGVLTSNVAVLEYKENKLIIKINLRVPVTYKLEDIKSQYEGIPNVKVTLLSLQNPLYCEKDGYLVKTLVNIFNKKTGFKAEPIAIGGGTYARAFKNCIAYGMTMPGEKDMCHQVDEFVKIDDLILSAKIYAEAIYELSK